MNKDELMKVLKDYLESDEIMNQFNLANAPLLEAERENLHKEETNWQSFVLSSLMKSPIIRREVSLFYHWQVMGLEPVEEVYRKFCSKENWVGKDKNWCMKKGRCWNKKKAELDAVLKDRDGNWLAIFEYEDDYNNCCQELCRMLKVVRSLKNQQSAHQAPVLCLFYWLPCKPFEKFQESRENLEMYKEFVLDNFYDDFAGTRFVFVLQSGLDEPPYAITKTRVVSDEKNFRNLKNVIKEEFEPVA